MTGSGGAPRTSSAGTLFEAPEAIQSSITLTSEGVSGGLPSVGMKSLSSGDKLIRRKSSLCFRSPGLTMTPSFPPRITFSKVSSRSLPFLFSALWQFEHLFSKIGATRAAKNVTDGVGVELMNAGATLAASIVGCTLFGMAGTESKERSFPGM